MPLSGLIWPAGIVSVWLAISTFYIRTRANWRDWTSDPVNRPKAEMDQARRWALVGILKKYEQERRYSVARTFMDKIDDLEFGQLDGQGIKDRLGNCVREFEKEVEESLVPEITSRYETFGADSFGPELTQLERSRERARMMKRHIMWGNIFARGAIVFILLFVLAGLVYVIAVLVEVEDLVAFRIPAAIGAFVSLAGLISFTILLYERCNSSPTTMGDLKRDMEEVDSSAASRLTSASVDRENGGE